jgi:hypothetical protein
VYNKSSLKLFALFVRNLGSNTATPKYLSLLQEKPQTSKNSQLVSYLCRCPRNIHFAARDIATATETSHLRDALFERLEHTVSTGQS